MNDKDFKEISTQIPELPGVYRYIASDQEILYIGKAKNLKKRLQSYFGDKKDIKKKTKMMLKASVRIEYTIVDTEQDALLLEATLIRKHQPRYNVALKHSRPYPYICIKNENFPRLEVSYKAIDPKATYFGPYPSKNRMYTLFGIIKELFQLRTCDYKLSDENIEKNKFKVCLEYHIKNCKAPCVGLESKLEYQEKIDQIKNILKGQLSQVRKFIKDKMLLAAETLDFEKAAELKQKLQALENYQSKSTVVHAKIKDVDVFSIAFSEENDIAYVNYLKIVEGAIINAYTQEILVKIDESREDILSFAIEHIREKFHSISQEIIVPFPIEMIHQNIQISIPQSGDKKKLLDLSNKNVTYFIDQIKKEKEARENKITGLNTILEIMKRDLRMDVLPKHIECFDNSNLLGNQPVSSCVVFKNGKPSKKDYRHFHVKTVEGPNDFASMEEIVMRRYSRLLNEKADLPDLVIIDGGKGQLSAAMKSIQKLDLENKMTVVGIAKRLEEIFYPNDSIPLLISKKSPSLRIIQQARDEAHRFALQFHRDTRSKKFTESILDHIKGIGEKTKMKLLQEFKSIQNIKEASYQVLEEKTGKKTALLIRNYFDSND